MRFLTEVKKVKPRRMDFKMQKQGGRKSMEYGGEEQNKHLMILNQYLKYNNKERLLHKIKKLSMVGRSHSVVRGKAGKIQREIFLHTEEKGIVQ